MGTGVRPKAGRSPETEADPSQKIGNRLGPGPMREEPLKEKADRGPRSGKGAAQDLRTENGADPALAIGNEVDHGPRTDGGRDPKTDEGRDPKAVPLGEAGPETIPKTGREAD